MDNVDNRSISTPVKELDIGLVFLILVSIFILLIGIGFLMYYGFNTIPNGMVCLNDGQCQSNEICNDGICETITCVANSDCKGPGLECFKGDNSVQGYCYQRKCQTTGDCGDNNTLACINSVCMPVGTNCNSDDDCFRSSLKCNVNTSTCFQCLVDADCETGKCSGNGICYTNCDEPQSTVCINETVCDNGSCCPERFQNKNCSDCNPTNGEYCVDGACNCKPGLYGQKCRGDGDCLSNNCLEGYCVNTGDICRGNYDGRTPGYCPIETPYCSSGRCSSSRIGGACDFSFYDFPDNPESQMFNQYTACNGPSINGTNQNGTNQNGTNQNGTNQNGTNQNGNNIAGINSGIVTFCVNQICQTTSGWIGDSCTTDFDCTVGLSCFKDNRNGGGYCTPSNR